MDITRNELIEHAVRCMVRAIRLAINAGTQADADRFTDSAVRFARYAVRMAREIEG